MVLRGRLPLGHEICPIPPDRHLRLRLRDHRGRARPGWLGEGVHAVDLARDIERASCREGCNLGFNGDPYPLRNLELDWSTGLLLIVAQSRTFAPEQTASKGALTKCRAVRSYGCGDWAIPDGHNPSV
jgi:hypothetical protein